MQFQLKQQLMPKKQELQRKKQRLMQLKQLRKKEDADTAAKLQLKKSSG
ncbi:MAG: hypothetical protein U5K55_15620 [Aliarcobacter sp.]|nr:hypothetical protein [Aliarcobacter sp.]